MRVDTSSGSSLNMPYFCSADIRAACLLRVVIDVMMIGAKLKDRNNRCEARRIADCHGAGSGTPAVVEAICMPKDSQSCVKHTPARVPMTNVQNSKLVL